MDILNLNYRSTDENTKEIQKNESLHSYHDAVLLSVAELKVTHHFKNFN